MYYHFRYVDYIFGNETEARMFSKSCGLEVITHPHCNIYPMVTIVLLTSYMCKSVDGECREGCFENLRTASCFGKKKRGLLKVLIQWLWPKMGRYMFSSVGCITLDYMFTFLIIRTLVTETCWYSALELLFFKVSLYFCSRFVQP